MAEPSKAYKKSFGLKSNKGSLFKHSKLPLVYDERGKLSKVLSDTSKKERGLYSQRSDLDTSAVDKAVFMDINKKKSSKSSGEKLAGSIVEGAQSLYDLIGVKINMDKKGIDFDMGQGGSVDIPFGKNWDFNVWYKQGQKGGPAPSDYNFGVKIKRAI
jgi:hypothetical protein